METKPVAPQPAEPEVKPEVPAQPEEPVTLAPPEEETVELTEVEVKPKVPAEVEQPTPEASIPKVTPEVAVEAKPKLSPEEEAQIRSDIVKLNEELATVERNLSDLEFNYEGGFIDEAEYTEKMAQFQSKKDELKSKIKELESKLS